MYKKLPIVIAVVVLVLTIGCSSGLLSMATPTPEPTPTPQPTATPVPTATPACSAEDYAELNSYADNLEGILADGEKYISSNNILLLGMALGAVTSDTEALTALEVSPCAETAKEKLLECYGFADTTFGSAQTGNPSGAQTALGQARNACQEYRDIVSQATGE